MGVGILRRGIFHKINFPGVNFPGKILQGRDLTGLLYEILFICLTFSLPTQFCIWSCSGGIIRVLFLPCLNFLEKIPMEEEISRGDREND